MEKAFKLGLKESIKKANSPTEPLKQDYQKSVEYMMNTVGTINYRDDNLSSISEPWHTVHDKHHPTSLKAEVDYAN